jgi:hypothetical protein
MGQRAARRVPPRTQHATRLVACNARAHPTRARTHPLQRGSAGLLQPVCLADEVR